MQNGKRQILITYSSKNHIDSRALSNSKIPDIINSVNEGVTGVDIDIIKQNMRETLSGLMDIFEDDNISNHRMRVNEIEVSLCIDIDGRVSILSSVEGGIKTQASVVVKLKRENRNEG